MDFTNLAVPGRVAIYTYVSREDASFERVARARSVAAPSQVLGSLGRA
jgi:hypothetical protein